MLHRFWKNQRSWWDSKQNKCLCRSSRLKDSQKNICAGISFLIKLLTLQICKFFKNEPLAQVFSCEFCEICKNTYFAEHHGKTASDFSSINSSEGRIGKRNCKLWCKNQSISTNLGQKCKLSRKDSPVEIWTGFRISRSQMFLKVVVLKIWQILQENTCIGDTF